MLLNYLSAEIAFARYVRTNVPRVKEIEQLGLHCIFAQKNRTLDV
jgi:hypothetical protein